MKNRRTESSNLPWPLAKSFLSPARFVGAHRREPKSYYRVSIHDITHTDANCSCLCAREKDRASMCVLDTYRQSEIYVARGERGALKYYRFASRARVCIFMRGPADEDGKPETKEKERERKRKKKWRRSVMKRSERRG